MISNRFAQAGVLTMLAAATFSASPAQAQAPDPVQGQYDDQNHKPAPQGAGQPQAPAQAQPAQPSAVYQRAAIQTTDGRYVAPGGTIDGSNLKQFLNSGPDISATQMEEASIPADNLMQMPESVNNRADARAQEKARERAQAEANGQVASAGQQNPPKKQKKYHAHPILGAVAQPFVSTLNFMGFPVGLNEDKGIDASLSSDLPQTVRDADGAYNPNAKPGSQEHHNTWFGQ
ncbi:MAG: hypothetical protein KGS72_20430 [Cyanobacteria bacterium REEB67]|nr:hypothetical protein [Cyanobacteria bacterium REEB67]